MWETILRASCFFFFLCVFFFSLTASAAGEEEQAQLCNFRSFCLSWDHGAQGSLPLGSFLTVSWGSDSSQPAPAAFPGPVQPSVRASGRWQEFSS